MLVFARVFVKHEAGDPIAILEPLVSFGRTINLQACRKKLWPSSGQGVYKSF